MSPMPRGSRSRIKKDSGTGGATTSDPCIDGTVHNARDEPVANDMGFSVVGHFEIREIVLPCALPADACGALPRARAVW